MKTQTIFRSLSVFAAFFAFGSCTQRNYVVDSTIEVQNEISVGDWSTNPELFHTEGDFKNGSIWQISSNGQNFSYWTSDGKSERRKKLSGYFEALQLSEELKNKGYTCDSYDYSY